MENGILRLVALIQGAIYIVTGLWPLLSMRTFMYVTGPKTDLWLVQTVGVLLALTGVLLLRAVRRRHYPSDLILLAGGQALGLAIIDLVFVARGVISPIYLLDAAAELVFVGAWIAGATVAARAGR